MALYLYKMWFLKFQPSYNHLSKDLFESWWLTIQLCTVIWYFATIDFKLKKKKKKKEIFYTHS